ncbi:ubiquinol-cytochrome c reductase cytochrome b subunit [Streptomyces sp. 5-8]|uniref:Cytochrome bc1 complex cytochrome b subunit n=1 Tax=Streptomyces musisoli TaxID=2802280 RepID=A0ABS1NVC5_9ACTN|nr:MULTISPECIES: ubiquinol-cytochrome c reductase cytochrome b subunit [Streptomyces]MBL1104060.1 ubiquinol-cytochrome c reductase cytochrome b subunit [Streptomyces musisoli]MBY8840132.1 ubiquinol-cytochrome c reductase cytochrome b subunit [Streptomyces sp. SP2-10]
MSRAGRRAERLVDAADARLPVLEGGSLLRKAFPEHWSFFLGELALYSLLVLILTGVWLTFFFQPEMREVVYAGSYVPLRGVRMSAAFDSTLRISFDVRGGLLMRQAHHWAALVFVAAIGVHMLRILFTGAFRRPRELNWVIGVTLFMVSLAEGFAGYSLPDDLLSGTGLRIAQGIMMSLPVVGTYVAFFVFGGEYPGHDIITRLYPLHILLLPGVLIALVTVHLVLVFHLKHTQWRGPGRTNRNVLGKPLVPQFTATSTGLSLTVFGVLVLMSGLAQINPVWTYGPYRPDLVSTGSQPDWYVGFLEGALRLVPPWETNVAGHTLMWNVLLPAVVLPGLLFAVLYAYPFVEQRLTGEWHHEQHLCDRPRERPVRTGLGVAGTVCYGVLLLAGGNDIIALTFRVSVNALTWVFRVALVVAPVVAFLVTRWVCRALTAAERERLAEGVPTGDIRQTVAGGYESDHEPVETFRPGAPRRPLTGVRTGTPSRTPREPERPGR